MTDLNWPPASRWPWLATRLSTGAPARRANRVTTRPVAASTLAMLAAWVPCTELNEPPRNALPQPPLNAMLFTSPLTSGFQLLIVNGAVAWKLNALFLVNVRPCHVTWLNRPTAYIREPHCTSCLTCSTPGVTGGKAGVPRAGRLAGTCPAGRCATGGRATARAMARAGAGRVWA